MYLRICVSTERFPISYPHCEVSGNKCLFGLICRLLVMMQIKGLRVLQRWKHGYHNVKRVYKAAVFPQYIMFSFLRKKCN